jgi:hypothetical protein
VARTSATFRLIVLSLVVAVAAPLSLYFALLEAGSNTPNAGPLSILMLCVAISAFLGGVVIISRRGTEKSSHQLAWLLAVAAAAFLVWTIFEMTIA